MSGMQKEKKYYKLKEAADHLKANESDLLDYAVRGDIRLCIWTVGKLGVFNKEGEFIQPISDVDQLYPFRGYIQIPKESIGLDDWGILPFYPINIIEDLSAHSDHKPPETNPPNSIRVCNAIIAMKTQEILRKNRPKSKIISYGYIDDEGNNIQIPACDVDKEIATLENKDVSFFRDQIVSLSIEVKHEHIRIPFSDLQKLLDQQQKITALTKKNIEKPLSTTERNTLLTIIGVMAKCGYGKELNKPYELAKEIKRDAESLGIRISDDTIASKIKEAEKILEEKQE